MLLSKLTPAETLLIRDGDQVSIRELLKYTFMDLVLKQVLMTEDVTRQAGMHDPLVVYKYVSTGKNFNRYASMPHELIFLLPFRGNPDARILFKNCVQMGYENAYSEKALHKVIMTSPLLADVFSQSFKQKIFGGYSHTDRGLELRRLVVQEMSVVEQDLEYLMLKDNEKAVEKMKLICGNVFLLQGLSFTVLREIDAAFANGPVWKERSDDGCGGGCGGWTTFNTYSNDFDSSCSSDSGDSSSGCSSGDGGCSSGCGGCGGGD